MKSNETNPLRARRIVATADDGHVFEATVDVRLLEDGSFSVSAPEELEASLTVLSKGTLSGQAHLGSARQGAKPRVYAKALDDALRLLQEAAEDYIKVEETTERVLCYTTQIGVTFWEGRKGEIYPNGCGHQNDGQWWVSKQYGHQFHATNRLKMLAFGVAAKVFDKITTKRASGNRVRYVETDFEDGTRHEKQTDPALMLNSWTVLDVNPEDARTRQMPYTPEAALFFYELQQTICRMARGLDHFVSDEKLLNKAIAERKQLLLG